jgi:hypothetical protein
MQGTTSLVLHINKLILRFEEDALQRRAYLTVSASKIWQSFASQSAMRPLLTSTGPSRPV